MKPELGFQGKSLLGCTSIRTDLVIHLIFGLPQSKRDNVAGVFLIHLHLSLFECFLFLDFSSDLCHPICSMSSLRCLNLSRRLTVDFLASHCSSRLVCSFLAQPFHHRILREHYISLTCNSANVRLLLEQMVKQAEDTLCILLFSPL